MPDTITTVDGRAFAASTDGLADSTEWKIDPQDADTGALEIHNIAHGGSCDVELVVSTDDTAYTPGARVALDSFSGEGVSQGNEIEIHDNGNLYLVITNTSGGPADFIVTGRQVSP